MRKVKKKKGASTFLQRPLWLLYTGRKLGVVLGGVGSARGVIRSGFDEEQVADTAHFGEVILVGDGAEDDPAVKLGLVVDELLEEQARVNGLLLSVELTADVAEENGHVLLEEVVAGFAVLMLEGEREVIVGGVAIAVGDVLPCVEGDAVIAFDHFGLEGAVHEVS